MKIMLLCPVVLRLESIDHVGAQTDMTTATLKYDEHHSGNQEFEQTGAGKCRVGRLCIIGCVN